MRLRIDELLKERNMTMSDLARKVGVLPTTLSGKGELKPSLNKMMEYARALGIPTWELLHDCGISGYGLPETQEVVSAAEVSAPCPHCGAMVQLTLITRWATRIETAQHPEPVLRIREIMDQKEISIKTMCERTGMSRPTISTSINSGGNINFSTIERMAAALEVEPWEIFTQPDDVRAEVARRRKLRDEGVSAKAPDILPNARCAGCGMIMSVGF